VRKGLSVFQRVVVVGAAGSGKTTLAKEIANRIGAPHIELDALKYKQDWTAASDESFRGEVAAHVGTDLWVIDGNYAEVRDLVWLRAQLLVWIDLHLIIILWRLAQRTFRRLLNKEIFASGNREQLNRVFGKQSIFLWTIRSYYRRRKSYEELLKHPRYAHLHVVRLRSPSAVKEWVARSSDSVEQL
jgi:adenylate kinase family enzyme